MKIAVIGHGFVGKAVSYAFTIPSNTVQVIDPIYNSHISELDEDTHFAFVCVPTPMGPNGAIDSDIVMTCVNEVVERAPHAIIVLKSTVTPEIINDLSSDEVAGARLVYNPEFLTERSAQEQFINPPFHILGGRAESAHKVEKLYTYHSLCKPAPVHFMNSAEASFVKYGINTFLATKVTYFNQLFDAMLQTDHVRPNVVINAIGLDSRIGHSHTTVPGYDGRRGYGGACFPKDTTALLNDYPNMTVLEEAIETNKDYRAQYELDFREKEQNVRY
jgi:UDPglucose 6-dehydrogenase